MECCGSTQPKVIRATVNKVTHRFCVARITLGRVVVTSRECSSVRHLKFNLGSMSQEDCCVCWLLRQCVSEMAGEQVR